MGRVTGGRVVAWIIIAVLALLIVTTVVYMLIPTPAEPLALAGGMLA
jgi:hypothetical protein